MDTLTASTMNLVPSDGEIAAVRSAGVLLIHGGWESEIDLSRRACSATDDALTRAGIPVMTTPMSNTTGFRRLLLTDTRCVLNLANGPLAAGGPLISLRELAALPYVGSPAGASALAMDKHATLLLAHASGIATPAFTDDPAQARRMPLPVVAKPIQAGSSIDTVICRTREQLNDVITALTSRYGRCLVQTFLPGREFTVPVLEDANGVPVALPAVEVFPGEGIASTDIKYKHGRPPACPADIDQQLRDQLSDIAIRTHTTLGLRGYSRTDIRLDTTGQPGLLEINHVPGLAHASWLPLAARTTGLNHSDLIIRLCANALSRPPDTQNIGTGSAHDPRRWTLISGKPDTISTAAAVNLSPPSSQMLTIDDLPDWLTHTPNSPLVIEATYGNDPQKAVIRAALDMVTAQRTGPSITGAALAEDKNRHKTLLHALGVPIPTGVAASTTTFPGNGPWVLKNHHGRQTTGPRLIHTIEELTRAVNEIPADERAKWLVEEFIAGPQFITAIIADAAEPTILPTLLLPVPHDGLRTPQTTLKESTGISVAQLDQRTQREITELAHRLHTIMGTPALSRLDWRLDQRTTNIRILQHHVFPDAGPNSYIATAADIAGIDLNLAMTKSARTRTGPIADALRTALRSERAAAVSSG